MVTHRHCMVVHSHYPVGETRVQRQALALVDAGIKVDVVCLKHEDEPRNEILDGVRVTRLPVQRHKNRGMAFQLMEYLAFLLLSGSLLAARLPRRRYHTVQVHNLPDFLVLAAAPVKLAGARVILDLHDLMPELFAGRMERQMSSRIVRAIALQERMSCRFADHVITVTDDWEATLHKRACGSEKTSVVMNLADHRVFGRHARKATDTATVDIVYHGTFTARYGVDVLVNAFADAAGDDPRLRLTLLGDGELRPELVRLVEERGIEDLVTMSNGMLDTEELSHYLSTAHIGVVPNRSNIFTDGILPTKLLEYVAMGIPAIVSRTPGVAEYFDDQMVFFVEPGSAKELQEALVALAGNPARGSAMVDATAAFESTFSWEQQARQYVATVEALGPTPSREVDATRYA